MANTYLIHKDQQKVQKISLNQGNKGIPSSSLLVAGDDNLSSISSDSAQYFDVPPWQTRI